ncbi:uncharacterized protein TNIN_265551 [Trichonephila inaurata madagascariensis]|uniref:Uncharacterized protein n=1 Tax=Trichonephila inaurata madagascariensis TaxID=2747483 RepID=A0A8X6XWN4_9ARAC|nr:uncharacterized protein TNIN_265551 [Trichonephila inaurata madagascariensis]
MPLLPHSFLPFSALCPETTSTFISTGNPEPLTHQSGGRPRPRYGTRPLFPAPCVRHHDATGQDAGHQTGHLSGGPLHRGTPFAWRDPTGASKEPVTVHLVPSPRAFHDHEEPHPQQARLHQCGRGEA